MGNNYNTEQTFALTTSVVRVLPYNANRQSLFLINPSAAIASFGFNDGASIPIPAGQAVLWTEKCPTNAIFAKSASTGDFIVTEA